jgi:hypothetical protein
MEQHNALGNIIAELLARGYTLDLHPQCAADCRCITGGGLPANEFTVDAVYCCPGAGSPPEMVYVLAVSAPRYHLKGIVINVVLPDTVNWGRVITGWYIRTKHALMKLISKPKT